jgi:outer membrane murein-binding lipoprotein Lpp
MKKLYFIILGAALCATSVSCGGGGASKNDYLGNLPGLYSKFSQAEADLKASVEGKKMEEIVEAYTTLQAKEEQLKADVTAELAKLIGREIPVTYSEALVASGGQFYEATAVVVKYNKHDDSPGLDVTITAGADADPQALIWFCLADKDGAPIAGSGWGFSLSNSPISYHIDIKDDPAAYAKMASVHFVTKEEKDNI